MSPPISRRRVLTACTAGASVAVAGCLDGLTESDDGAGDGMGGEESEVVDATVSIGPEGDNDFEPLELEVPPDATVKWIWQSDNHTVSPRTLPADAEWRGVLDPHDEGYTYTHTFDTIGVYQYLCEEHSGTGYAIVHVREDTALAEE